MILRPIHALLVAMCVAAAPAPAAAADSGDSLAGLSVLSGDSATSTLPPPDWVACGNTCPAVFENLGAIYAIQCPGSLPLLNASYCMLLHPTGSMTANPPIVTIPNGQSLGSTAISWSSDSSWPYTTVTVSTDGGAETVFGTGGNQGSGTASWIAPGHQYNFRLYRSPYDNGSHAASDYVTSVLVTGQRPASITASPNPVTTAAPDTLGVGHGTTTVTWNASASGYTNVCVVQRTMMTNGVPMDTFLSSGVTGSRVVQVAVGQRNAGNYTFFLHGAAPTADCQQGTVLSQVNVHVYLP